MRRLHRVGHGVDAVDGDDGGAGGVAQDAAALELREEEQCSVNLRPKNEVAVVLAVVL